MSKVGTLITPGIDAVLHARIDAMSRSQWATRTGPTKLPFVTISREYGCEGYAVARAIEKGLNEVPDDVFPWMTFDKEILARIAEESGYYPGLVRLITEDRLPTIGRFVIDMLSGLPNEYEIYQRMAKSICVLADRGNAILIGRGAAFITREIERGLHIRLVAPLEYRVDRIAKVHILDREAAEKEVRRMEVEREAFVQRFTMRSVNDSALYHMIFNNALCRVEDIARTAIAFLRGRKWI